MKRLLNPLLLLMASAPEADKKLDLLMLALQATTDSVKNIKNGIDAFQASLVKMATNEPGPAQDQKPSTDSNQPFQKPNQEKNTAPSVGNGDPSGTGPGN